MGGDVGTREHEDILAVNWRSSLQREIVSESET